MYKMDHSSLLDHHEQRHQISSMDSDLYKAAEKGNLDAFNGYARPLDQLLSPNKNTILHIYITALRKPRLHKKFFCSIHEQGEAPISLPFLTEILNRSPSLLVQANTKGETPLHIAARYGHDNIITFLIDYTQSQQVDLERGVEAVKEMLRTTTIDKDTALHEAVRNNHFATARRIIKEDPDFQCSANAAGETPLYLAAETGHGDIVSLILETCTTPEYKGPSGRTALHAAVINNNAEITRKLLPIWNLTKEVDQQGWAPLHHASHFGHLTIVKQLLEHDKSAAYIRDKDGQKTALHIAASFGSKHAKIMSEIISHCPDCCEIVDERGWNFIHFAVESYNYVGIRYVLRNPSLSSLLNQKDHRGNTPLHLLGASGFFMTTLITHPLVDKNAVNKQNLTALDLLMARQDDNLLAMRTHTYRRMEQAGFNQSHRNKIKHNIVKKVESVESFISELKTAKEAHLVVATLIATVAFAAGFTLPGGYISDKGTDQGNAILTRKASFKIFLISDAISFVLSTFVVLIHFLLAMQGSKKRFLSLFVVASFLIVIAMASMVVAFTAGTYAVLPHSSGLGVVICIISACFFIFCCYILKRSLSIRLVYKEMLYLVVRFFVLELSQAD